MHFRVCRYGDVEVGDGAQEFDQVFGVKRFFLIAGRLVAAQGDNTADAAVPIVFGDLAQFVGRGVDAGQVRRGFQAGFLLDAFDDAVRTVAFAGVCAVGYGDEFGMQGLQAMDGVPQHGFHLFVFRREKFERNVDVAFQVGKAVV